MVDAAAVPAAAAKKKATDDAEAAAAAAAKKKATDDAEAAAAAAALTWPTGGNKGLMLSAGIVGLLEQMTSNPRLAAAATALYLNLSCLTDAKSVIASTQAVPFLVDRLYNHDACDPKASSCKHDALYTLYNLSTHQASIPSLLSAGIVDALHTLLTDSSVSEGIRWTEKALAVAISLAATPAGRKEIMSTPGLVSTLAVLLDTGEPTEQEQEVSCLLAMCAADDKCIAPVLQEGVVPSLVFVSTTGTGRGREKAQKLLKLFREQRQRDGGQPPASQHQQPQQEQQRRENDSNTEINSGCCVVL